MFKPELFENSRTSMTAEGAPPPTQAGTWKLN
jgi:hypothetical protein